MDSNDPGEDWNSAENWEGQVAPSEGEDSLVDGLVAGVLRSPVDADPVFGGKSLSLRGPNARLFLSHRGVATVNGLSLKEAILVASTSNALSGDGLTVDGVNGILIENGSVLELRSPILGSGSLEVLGTFLEEGGSSGGIRLTGSGSDHAVN